MTTGWIEVRGTSRLRMTERYRLELTPDDDGTFLVTCPELPEVTSFGATWEEAMSYGRLAVEEAIAARIAVAGSLSPRKTHRR
jgi:predicted RNase H-like HicB family nuclease